MESLQRLCASLVIALGFYATTWGMDDTHVEVFDVGHGNCVLVTYRNQGLMIDAGSKGLPLNALYDDMFGKKETVHVVEGVASKEDCYDWDDFLSTPSFSSFDTDEQDHLPETEVGPKQQSRRLDKSYKAHQIDQIKASLNKLTSVKVVVSHSDVDHYKWLPQIYKTKEEIKKINTIILGGISECYKNRTGRKLMHWVGLVKDHNPSLVAKFTGEHIGKNSFICGAFSSLMEETTWDPRERKIVELLQFSGDTAPKVQVLAMNAGCHNRKFEEYLSCVHPNVNSIVLRINAKRSFIIPGDATKETWEFISSFGGNIVSEYLLLSHHGASSAGETSEMMLKMVQPKLCILSAGCHQKYQSPSKQTIELINGFGITDQVCPLSCYNENVKVVVNFGKRFGSTLDDGSMCVNLASGEEINVHTSRCRQVNFNKDFLLTNGWTKNVISYTAAEISGVDTNQICFYKCSPRSNVLVFNKENKEAEEKESVPIYMQDLVTGKFYQISKKL
jgi:hypothetical protein